MSKYKDLVKRVVTDYNKRFADNKDNLIEAFVVYYGEEFRKQITDVINNIIVAWNINYDISELYANGVVRHRILANRISYTKEVLNRLGYDVDDIQCKAMLGRIFFRKGEPCIDPGMIYDSCNSKNGTDLDGILELLYGKKRLFNFNYKDDLIYNFYTYSEKGKKELVRILFGKSDVDEECLEKIDSVIKYMDSILEMKEEEKRFADFLIVYNKLESSALLDRGAQYKNILSKLFGVFRPKIIGSYNDVLLQDKYREFTKFLNSMPLDKSFCQNVYETVNDESFKVMVLPILCSSDSAFIHELNHGVTSQILAECTEGGIIEKYGISINDDTKLNPTTNRINLEELLNQASSLEITDLFHKLGGMMFDEDLEFYGIREKHLYNSFLPLINGFYSTYKNVLKKPRMTSSLNSLFEYADRDVFDEYVEFVNAINDYGRDVNCEVDGVSSLASFDEIAYADELVERMRTATFNEEILPEGQTAEKTDFSVLISPAVKTYKKQM